MTDPTPLTLDEFRRMAPALNVSRLSRAVTGADTQTGRAYLGQVILGRSPWTDDVARRVTAALAAHGLAYCEACETEANAPTAGSATCRPAATKSTRVGAPRPA